MFKCKKRLSDDSKLGRPVHKPLKDQILLLNATAVSLSEEGSARKMPDSKTFSEENSEPVKFNNKHKDTLNHSTKANVHKKWCNFKRN